MPLKSMVLLPGMDGTGLLFQPLIDAFPRAVNTIVVRYPGDQVLGHEALLPLVLRALPTTGRYVILGESFSGPLAVMAAAPRPRGLAGVVLCAPFVTPPFAAYLTDWTGESRPPWWVGRTRSSNVLRKNQPRPLSSFSTPQLSFFDQSLFTDLEENISGIEAFE